MVDILHHALTEMTFDDGPKPIEVFVDGKFNMRGNTNAYSNPAIEAGIVNARALLEFLGLKVDPKNPSKLKERGDVKRSDDLYIEDFENNQGNLSKVRIANVKAYYPGPESEAEGALARIIYIGHKEIAHPTLGRESTDDDYAMLEIAARGIRALTVTFFFYKAGAACSCITSELYPCLTITSKIAPLRCAGPPYAALQSALYVGVETVEK
ncbi:MAG: hypothetical protein ACRBCS_09015, partial [Cellvibrionaceae bacterium]